MINTEALLTDVLSQTIAESHTYWSCKIVRQHYKKVHLAIMVEPYLSLILSGKKTIESRFSKKRIIPFECVEDGDIVILKKSGGNVVAVFEVASVDFYTMCSEDIVAIKDEYNDRICGNDLFWESKKDSRYATLIGIKNLFILSPIIIKQKNRQAWISSENHAYVPQLFCLSGKIASGKTFISKELSSYFECKRFSVSDYLKSIANKRGEDTNKRDILQKIGEEQINLGWEKFCKNFLEFSEWDYKSNLIIDGIRHQEFFETLRKIVLPIKTLLIYVNADENIRQLRLDGRKEAKIDITTLAEGNLDALFAIADVIVENNTNNSSDSIKRVLVASFERNCEDSL